MRELTFSPSTASLRELKGPLTSLLNRLTVIFKRFPGKASTAAAAANGAAAQAALTSIIEAAWPVIKQYGRGGAGRRALGGAGNDPSA